LAAELILSNLAHPSFEGWAFLMQFFDVLTSSVVDFCFVEK